jgi:hypothetical protein
MPFKNSTVTFSPLEELIRRLIVKGQERMNLQLLYPALKMPENHTVSQIIIRPLDQKEMINV